MLLGWKYFDQIRICVNVAGSFKKISSETSQLNEKHLNNVRESGKRAINKRSKHYLLLNG